MFGLRVLPAICAGIFLAGASGVTAQAPNDQTQILQTLQDFWNAYSVQALDAVLTLWDPQSPEFVESRETLRIHFASYRLVLESPGIPEVTFHGDSAHVVVAARITGIDKVNGLPAVDGFRSPKRVFDLKKIGAAWKIENFAPAERPLADALIKAGTPVERESLLEASPDLVNPELAVILARIARRTSIHGENDRGLQIAEIALKIAQRLEDHHALTQAWTAKAQIHIKTGEFEKARASAESALQAALNGNSRVDESLARRSLGWLFTQINDPKNALTELEKAVSLAHGVDRYAESDALDALGEAYRQSGKLDQALATFRASLQIDSDRHNRDGVSAADTNIANVLYMKGEYTQALKYLEDARVISHELNDPGGEAITLNTIGATYDATGHYHEALKAYEESKALRKAADDLVGMIFCDCNIAIVLMEMGKTPEAVSAFEDCYARAHEKGIKSLENDSMSNLGSLYINTGRYGLALDKLNLAVERAKEIQDPISLAQTIGNVATVYEKTGRTADALAEFEEIIKEFRSSGVKDEQARTLGNLAALHARRKEYRQAEAELLESLKLRIDLTDSEGIVDAHSSLADLYRESGKYEQAIEQGFQAVRAVTAIENPAYQAQAHLALGRAIAKKDPQKSREEFETARERAESVSAIEIMIESDTGLGELDIAAQKWNDADTHCRAAMEEAEEVRTGSIDPILKLGIQEMKSRAVGCRLTALLALRRNEEAFEVAEAAKARTLEETIGARGPMLAKVPAERLEEINELDAKARDLSNKLLTAGPSRDVYKELLTAERDADTKRRELYVTYAPQAPGPPDKPISMADVGLLLPDPATAFLEYVVSENAVFLFVIRKPAAAAVPELAARRIPLSSDLLRVQVRNLRAGIRSLGITVPEQALLFNELIAPAKPLLNGVTTLGIVPDAELWEIPFAVLSDENGLPLMGSLASFYAPSLSVLRDLESQADRRPSARQGSLLLIGNPYLGSGGSLTIPFRGSFKDLVNAEQEVNAIADVARRYGVRTTRKIGVEATERFVKDEWGKNLYIHMALHGYSDRGDALSSFLLLAQDQQDKTEDGLLEAREILEQKLNANLVVLSACDSARGEVLSGELPLGLAWTLFAAGASSTVVTQWSIDDPTTAGLMKRFYELWAFGLGGPKGASKARSLQLAQQEMMKSGSSLDPALWGAFVLIGDPR